MNGMQISKHSGKDYVKVLFHFSDSTGARFVLDLSGSPFEEVFEDPLLVPMVMLAIMGGVFDGQIFQEQDPEPEDNLLDTLNNVLNNKN